MLAATIGDDSDESPDECYIEKLLLWLAGVRLFVTLAALRKPYPSNDYHPVTPVEPRSTQCARPNPRDNEKQTSHSTECAAHDDVDCQAI